MNRILCLLLLVPLLAQADELDRAIQSEMKQEGIPGLTFAVVSNGEIARLGAYGFANLEWQAATTSDTRFEIASISKMVTGAAARILVEEGRLDPEAPVSRYLGGLPPTWTAMKVRHLITMSSGLPEDWGMPHIPYNADVCTDYDDASMIKSFTTLPAAGPIGDRFHYSGPNYAMLGMIVAKIAGKSFPEFVQKRIFVAAGMTESLFIDNAAVVLHRAEGYRRENGQLKRGRYVGQYLHARPDVGLLMTARDLARFVMALESGKIVKEPQKLWLFPRSDTGHNLDYAYGWFSGTWFGHRVLSHAGGYRTGFHTFIARYPDDKLSVVLFTNCDFSAIRPLTNTIARTYLKDLPDPAVESTKTDTDPGTTNRLIAMMKAIAHGETDPGVYADAIDYVSPKEAQDFLSHVAPYRYAGRSSTHLTMHGRELVDYETLCTEIDDTPVYFRLYRDKAGKVGYVEMN